jgi:hypothetical protein
MTKQANPLFQAEKKADNLIVEILSRKQGLIL